MEGATDSWLTELTTSPLWRNNLISADGKTTAIVLTFKPDAEFNALRDEVTVSAVRRPAVTPDEERRLKTVRRKYNEKHAELRRSAPTCGTSGPSWPNTAPRVDFVESGVPIVIADMVSYIERTSSSSLRCWYFSPSCWPSLSPGKVDSASHHDLFYFGDLHDGIPGTDRPGNDGRLANFSSMLLIVGMQNAIYLIVRFREIHSRFPILTSRTSCSDGVKSAFRASTLPPAWPALPPSSPTVGP